MTYISEVVNRIKRWTGEERKAGVNNMVYRQTIQLLLWGVQLIIANKQLSIIVRFEVHVCHSVLFTSPTNYDEINDQN